MRLIADPRSPGCRDRDERRVGVSPTASSVWGVSSLVRMATPPSPLSPPLSPGQLETLAAVGEERTAAEGEFLFRIGDARYPFIVVLEGEAAILDGAGNEIARQGPANQSSTTPFISTKAPRWE